MPEIRLLVHMPFSVYVYSPILSTPSFKSPRSPGGGHKGTQRSLADEVFERMLELE